MRIQQFFIVVWAATQLFASASALPHHHHLHHLKHKGYPILMQTQSHPYYHGMQQQPAQQRPTNVIVTSVLQNRKVRQQG